MKSLKKVAIICARLGSKRLPAKHLLPILGRPMLELMLERVGQARLLDDCVLATTKLPTDDALIHLVSKLGIKYYRGSEQDVLDRVLEAARFFKAQVIVEIPGDNPLVDPTLIDQTIESFVSGGADYVRNAAVYNKAPGSDIRVFSIEALEKVNALTNEPEDHEHVSIYFLKNPTKFRVRQIEPDVPPGIENVRMTVDVLDDFNRVKKIYEELYPTSPHFTLADIVELSQRIPTLLTSV